MTAALVALERLFRKAGQAMNVCALKPEQFVREGQLTILQSALYF